MNLPANTQVGVAGQQTPADPDTQTASSGYNSPFYAQSLAEFGSPLALPQCGGWILERRIEGLSWTDGMGCYPLFSCRDWSKFSADVEALAGRLVTLTLVMDPFLPLTVGELRSCLDIVRPFKEHFVVDMTVPSEAHVTRHHRYYARKSLQSIRVEAVNDPSGDLDGWVGLYAKLIQRHQLRGIKAFSRECFHRQLGVPGLVMFKATRDEQLIGAQLWYVQGQVAYSHLTAVNETGYATRATYGIYWTAIQTFKERFSKSLRWLDLGAGAGLASDSRDGLAEFKQGWATGTQRALFCGRTFDRRAYQELSRNTGGKQVDYFPAYRAGEFS